MKPILKYLVAATGVLAALGFWRAQTILPETPEERGLRLPFARRPRIQRDTTIPPEQQPGGGAPHR